VAVEVLAGPVIAHRGSWVGVPGCDLHVPQVNAGIQTGREQCSNPVEWAGVLLIKWGYSSGLVIVGSGYVCGVAVPVGSGLVRPSDGGAR
jgi:hypothetical protein